MPLASKSEPVHSLFTFGSATRKHPTSTGTLSATVLSDEHKVTTPEQVKLCKQLLSPPIPKKSTELYGLHNTAHKTSEDLTDSND